MVGLFQLSEWLRSGAWAVEPSKQFPDVVWLNRHADPRRSDGTNSEVSSIHMRDGRGGNNVTDGRR